MVAASISFFLSDAIKAGTQPNDGCYQTCYEQQMYEQATKQVSVQCYSGWNQPNHSRHGTATANVPILGTLRIKNFDKFLSVYLLKTMLELKLKTAGYSIDTVTNDQRLATAVRGRILTTV